MAIAGSLPPIFPSGSTAASAAPTGTVPKREGVLLEAGVLFSCSGRGVRGGRKSMPSFQ